MRKTVDKLMHIISFLMGIMLFIAVGLIVVQIIFRYLLKSPIGWINQMCQFLYVWIVMLGLPVLFHNKAVTAFDYLSSKMSDKAQKILHIAISVLSMFFAICFIIFSWQFMMRIGGMMIPAFRVIPYYAVYISLPISGALLFIEMLLQFTESIRMLGGKEEL